MIKLGIVSIAAGVCCLLAFHLHESVVDEQGFLKEPFSLLPIGSALILAGVAAIVGTLLRRKFKQPPAC